MLGRRVATLVSAPLAPGTHTTRWVPESTAGGRLAVGVYAAKLRVNGETKTAKFIVVR